MKNNPLLLEEYNGTQKLILISKKGVFNKKRIYWKDNENGTLFFSNKLILVFI